MNRALLNEDPQTSQEEIIDLNVDGQDTGLSPSSEELSQLVTQLESEMDEKDKTTNKLEGTVNGPIDAVVGCSNSD